MTTVPHLRWDITGTLGTPQANEIFSFGIKIGVIDSGGEPAEITQGDVNGVLNALGNATSTYFGSDTMLYSDALMTRAYLSAITSTGARDPLIDTGIFDYGAGVPGDVTRANDIPCPYQVAVAIGLRGATYASGRAATGRWFLPAPVLTAIAGGSGAPFNEGQMDITVAAKFADAAVALLDAINQLAGAPSGQPTAILASNVPTGPVRWQAVSAVTVDCRPDTQRRRGDKLWNAPASTVPVS